MEFNPIACYKFKSSTKGTGAPARQVVWIGDDETVFIRSRFLSAEEVENGYKCVKKFKEIYLHERYSAFKFESILTIAEMIRLHMPQEWVWEPNNK